MPKRSRDSLARRKPLREPYPTFLIVCEGVVTEKEYFIDLRNLARIPITLNFRAGGVPRTLVQIAAEEKKKPNDFDQIWIVFDVDRHPDIASALQQAKDNDLPVAMSNPCFELWALLHFQDQNAHIERADVQRLCREHLPGYAKKLPTDKLMPHIQGAFARAAELRKRHARNQTDGHNPSTDVDKLVKTIIDAGRRPSAAGSAHYPRKRATP
jgi:hypothetical protein